LSLGGLFGEDKSMAKQKQSKDQSQVLDLVLQGKNELTEEIFDALYQEIWLRYTLIVGVFPSIFWKMMITIKKLELV
jgi:hypothetical protein